jgi:hypothetical protein
MSTPDPFLAPSFPAPAGARRHPATRRARGMAKLPRLLGVLAASALAAGALGVPAAFAATSEVPGDSGNYLFETLNDRHDSTFNQLLGINDASLIAGYYGSGQTGQPNRGYLLAPPAHYRVENYPGSAQTQVTGLNNSGITVGFWVDRTADNSGFYTRGGHFYGVDFPTSDSAHPRVDQLLGVNDSEVAVGFYTDKHGTNHSFSYDIVRRSFRTIRVAADTNVTAAAINNVGDIAGSATNPSGTTEAFLKLSDGKVLHLNVPGATSTQAFGVNSGDDVVGDYTVGSGSSAVTHGFVWAPGFGFETVDAPNATGGTTINGVNDRGDLVGFYVDASGNTDGLVATPRP